MIPTISDTTAAELDQLYHDQNNYKPNDDIARALQAIKVFMLVGAACEGKSTAIQVASKHDAQFGMAGNFTSRKPRLDDGEGIYTYYDHTDAGLAPLLERIRHHEVVQYACNPINKTIYGSELSDYTFDYNVKDVWASATDGFRQLGFGTCQAATIITNPHVWLERFDWRYPVGSEQRSARLAEAVQSFTWSLAQPEDGSHFWIENNTEDGAALELIAIAKGEHQGNPAARELCKQSLAIVQDMAA